VFDEPMRMCHRSLDEATGGGHDRRGMDLDPAHLRSFLAIVRFGGYHRAAEALHLTQPAVSRHMRRLEAQLGEPLFERRGRGVELTPYGERAAAELGAVLAAHDRAVARLRRGGHGDRPFVLGVIENLVDPVLPDLLAIVREQVGERTVQLRVDRSFELVERVAGGEVDAALVLDTGGAAGAIELGPLTLRWWAAPALAAAAAPPEPFPLVAYDPPCGLRDLALRRLAQLGVDPELMAQSPHLSGVHAAVRNGLGYALLAAGGDGLRPVRRGPLAGTIDARLWLLVGREHRALAAPLRAALWRAMTRQALPEAAA
jgi:DNA-binding transcriptional LysR family regulator